MKLDLHSARNFLARFNYELTTLQVFPTVIDGKARWPKRGGQILCTGEQGSTATAFTGPLPIDLIPDLKLLQQQRMGVYFQVNEGDGQLHGHKIVRNSDSVIVLKSLFVDTDDGDPKKLKAFCKQHKIRPHVIVESSPGKFHYYFLLEDAPSNKENVYLWQSCQHCFEGIDNAYDKSMADLGQVLRVPGFYHTKQSPFLIREVYASNHKRYRLSDIYGRIGAEKTPPRKGKQFERPTESLDLGARHEALSAYLGSLSNTVRDPDVLIDAGIGFAQRHFKAADEWRDGGSRYSELLRQVSYVLDEREKEDLAHSLQVAESVPVNGFKKLPDDFYLKAPGIVGKIVREVCHYSPQPYPSFAFAAAASMIGTLKSPFVRGEYQNTPPSTYFLCLAESGRGKDFPRDIIAKAFVKLGFRSLLTQKFRSAQGFLKRLQKSNGIHLVLHDEAHHLFAQIRKSDSEYITALKPALLSLYSSANSPVFDVGAVVTEKMEIDPIPYPTLNYCGFGVPTGFEDNFQGGELSEGLLTRFLVIRDHQEVRPISKEHSKIPTKFKFEQHLEDLANSLRLQMETVLLKDDKKSDIRKFVRIPMDDDAFDLLQAYSTRIADSRNSLTGTAKDTLQSRLVEQVGRLAVMLSDTHTTKEIVQFAITFVDHCYDNVAIHAESFNKGQGNKDVEDLLEFISNRMRISKGPMLLEEFRFFRIRDRNHLNNAIQLAIDMGRLQKVDNFRKPGQTKGRLATAYIVTEFI